MKKLLWLLLLFIPLAAYAQVSGGVRQHGAVTGGDCVEWYGTNSIMDAGSACGSGGGGGVSSFTSDGTLLLNATTTGAVTQTLANAPAYSVWGNAIGSAGAPGYTNSPTVLSLTTSVGGALTVGGNASLAGTTTANNLSVTGTFNLGGSALSLPVSIANGGTGSGTAAADTVFGNPSNSSGAPGFTTAPVVSGASTAASFNATNTASAPAYQIGGVNALKFPDNNLDVTSIAVGSLSLPSYTTTTGNNVAVGYNALNALTTGTNSVAIGSNALSKETVVGSEVAIGVGALQNSLQSVTTAGNVAIGYNALNSATTSLIGATAIGYGTLAALATGNTGVTAIGYNALAAMNSASANGNTAVGYIAGAKITTGGANTLIGYDAGNAITGNQYETIIGYGAGGDPGSYSTVIGAAAKATGSQDVSIGYSAGGSSSGGNGNNTFVGVQAGYSVTSGQDNILIGHHSLGGTLSTGSFNVLMGDEVNTALSTTTSSIGIGENVKPGSNDVAIGISALGASTTNGNDNTAIGFKALTATTSAGAATIMGNVAIGFQAASLNSTGTGNIEIGYDTDSTVGTIGSDNILIGNSLALSTSSTSNTINIGGVYKATGIGTPSTSQSTIAGALNVTTTLQQGIELSCSTGLTTDASGNINGCVASDRSLKLDVTVLKYDPKVIEKLRPVSYAWRDPSRYDGKRHGGFIAQEVQIVDPLAVKSAGKGLLGIDNSALEGDIVLDLQNLHRLAARQQAEIDLLKKQVAKKK
ncbi:MAG: tail fiber domain-containing protein [Thermoplasmata archaeon]